MCLQGSLLAKFPAKAFHELAELFLVSATETNKVFMRAENHPLALILADRPGLELLELNLGQIDC